MTTPIPDKLSFEDLRASMSMFLDFPKVEQDMLAEVENRITYTLASSPAPANQDVDILMAYLDAGAHTKFRIRAIISLAGISLERLKRLLRLFFPNQKVDIQHIESRADVRARVAELLLAPDNSGEFIPRFIAQGIELPSNWYALLSDRAHLRKIIMHDLGSLYGTRMGLELEKHIVDIVENAGYAGEKGYVELADSKEIDIAIPNESAPCVLIMSCYNVTTSSAQSSRANEQARIYQRVEEHNRSAARRKRRKVYLVNVVDGGGWIERKHDLRKLYDECHYCLSYATLNQLPAILRHAVC